MNSSPSWPTPPTLLTLLPPPPPPRVTYITMVTAPGVPHQHNVYISYSNHHLGTGCGCDMYVSHPQTLLAPSTCDLHPPPSIEIHQRLQT